MDWQENHPWAGVFPATPCHDEYLLATLLEGCDGALVGFAGFVPELIVETVRCALNGDLVGARKAQKLVEPLSRIVYNFGEPSGDAHQRMKCARWLIGKFPSMKMRSPLRPLPEVEASKIRSGLEAIGYSCVQKSTKINSFISTTTINS